MTSIGNNTELGPKTQITNASYTLESDSKFTRKMNGAKKKKKEFPEEYLEQ